jgi:hypothetical protein
MQRLAGKPVHGTRCVGLAGGDDEHPGHVVGAVAVLATRVGEQRMFEGGAVVRHPKQMGERRVGDGGGHAGAD